MITRRNMLTSVVASLLVPIIPDTKVHSGLKSLLIHWAKRPTVDSIKMFPVIEALTTRNQTDAQTWLDHNLPGHTATVAEDGSYYAVKGPMINYSLRVLPRSEFGNSAYVIEENFNERSQNKMAIS